MPERRTKSYSPSTADVSPAPKLYKKNSPTTIIIVAAAVLIIVFGGLFAILKLTKTDLFGTKGATAAIDNMDWKAVFLNNAEIYFGTIKKQTNNQLVLENIYYITKTAADKSVQPNFSLVKLGNEIFGPEDRMYINMQNVLYVEDLQKNSQVIQAIKRYNEDKNNPSVQNIQPVVPNAPDAQVPPSVNASSGTDEHIPPQKLPNQ
jgi:hypothetical protein